MVIFLIALLVVIIVVLIAYNFHIKKMLETHNNLNEKVNSLSVLQNFMDIAGIGRAHV